MKRTMQGVIGLLALGALAGCSGDKLAEKITEQQIEKATGGSADIDLSDGNIKVQTSDGSFEMSTDENGNVVIKTKDADGNEIVSAQSEDGVTKIQTEDGDATITNNGDDSELKIEGDDGTATFSSNGDLPDGFPDLPFPDDMTVVASQKSDGADGTSYVMVASAPGSWEDYLDELTSYLDDNGYVQQSLTTTPDGGFFGYTDAGGTTTITGGVALDPNDDGMAINIAITPS